MSTVNNENSTDTNTDTEVNTLQIPSMPSSTNLINKYYYSDKANIKIPPYQLFIDNIRSSILELLNNTDELIKYGIKYVKQHNQKYLLLFTKIFIYEHESVNQFQSSYATIEPAIKQYENPDLRQIYVEIDLDFLENQFIDFYDYMVSHLSDTRTLSNIKKLEKSVNTVTEMAYSRQKTMSRSEIDSLCDILEFTKTKLNSSKISYENFINHDLIRNIEMKVLCPTIHKLITLKNKCIANIIDIIKSWYMYFSESIDFSTYQNTSYIVYSQTRQPIPISTPITKSSKTNSNTNIYSLDKNISNTIKMSKSSAHSSSASSSVEKYQPINPIQKLPQSKSANVKIITPKIPTTPSLVGNELIGWYNNNGNGNKQK